MSTTNVQPVSGARAGQTSGDAQTPERASSRVRRGLLYKLAARLGLCPAQRATRL
jgi:hypothetical protein